MFITIDPMWHAFIARKRALLESLQTGNREPFRSSEDEVSSRFLEGPKVSSASIEQHRNQAEINEPLRYFNPARGRR